MWIDPTSIDPVDIAIRTAIKNGSGDSEVDEGNGIAVAIVLGSCALIAIAGIVAICLL